MSKTMKKIGTIFAAATLVGATLTGAIAADLKDLPAPFVKNGQADVTIVVGASAATADVLGSIDIASALQAASVTTTTVAAAGGAKSSVEGGVEIAQSGNALILGRALSTAKPRVTSTDLPELLADQTLRVQSNSKDYKYTQELTFGANTVKFDKSPSALDSPALYLDTKSNAAWTYNLSVKGTALNLTAADDSETLVMLGKSFTIDPSTPLTGDVTLYGSDHSEYLTLNQPKTFTVEGKSYTVEITGGNSNAQSGTGSVVVSVNGVSKTMKQADTVTINGLELFAKDVFVTDIPTLSASATLFVGSQKIKFTGGANNAATIEINGNSINGLTGKILGNDNGRVSGIEISYKPADLNGDIAGFDETEFLTAGKSISEPLFGTFEMKFVGPNYALDDSAAKVPVEVRASGREVQFSFVNDDGNAVKFSPFYVVSATSVDDYFTGSGDAKGWDGTSNASIAEKQVFIVNEGSSVKQTKVYEVVGFKLDQSVNYVRLKEIGAGTTAEYKAGDQLGSSSTYVGGVDQANKIFNLTAATSNVVYLQGGRNSVTINKNVSGGAAHFILSESSAAKDQTSVVDVNVSISGAGTNGQDPHIAVVSGATVVNDDGNKLGHALTNYGTYITADVDTDKTYVKAYVPKDRDQEAHYEAFIAPIGASVTATAAGTVTTQKVNPLAVGTAVLDSSVALATESKNLIVVGGPCANSVAAALLKSTKDNCGAGFTPGKAVVQLFDTPMGKTAMLVAGYEATETQAASRAVALMDKRLVGKSVTLTVTNTNDFTISSSQ